MLSVNEVAKQLGIKPNTLYRHIRNGVIEHYRIGGKTLFTQQQVDEFLASCLKPMKN